MTLLKDKCENQTVCVCGGPVVQESAFQTEKKKLHNWSLLKIFYVFLSMSGKQWHTSNQMFVIIIFHMQENSEILHTYKVMKFSGPIIT